jgi:predicted nucleotide-binding protein
MPSRPASIPRQPGPRGTTGRADYPRVAEPPDASRSQLVFVVHGRNGTARLAIFEFLRSIGLSPIEWHQAITATGKASPYISEVVDAGLGAAQAVVVLWTPDEVVSLRPEYADGEDDPDVRPGFQSRPNVMFEAGLALGRAPDRVVLAELGHMRHFSDLLGRHTVRLSNSVASRQELAIRLRTAGCAVDLSGTGWHSAGDFSSPPQPVLSWRIRGRATGLRGRNRR